MKIDPSILAAGNHDLHRAPPTVRRAYKALLDAVEAAPAAPVEWKTHPPVPPVVAAPAGIVENARSYRDAWVVRLGGQHLQRQLAHFASMPGRKVGVIVGDVLQRFMQGVYASVQDSDAVIEAALFVHGFLNHANARDDNKLLIELEEGLRDIDSRARNALAQRDDVVRKFIEHVLDLAPEHRDVYYWLVDKRDTWMSGQVYQTTPVILPEHETRSRAICELGEALAEARVRRRIEDVREQLETAKPELFASRTSSTENEEVDDLWIALVLLRNEHNERFQRIEDEAATLEARVRELETATFKDREGM